jgi:4-hydroxybenzoate polyprenyltransferase
LLTGLEAFSSVEAEKKEETIMDLLIINLVFSSVAPLLLWRLRQKALAILQVPFVVAMWIMLPEILPLSAPRADSTFLWWTLFYFNMAFGYLAMGMLLFRWANRFWGKEEKREEERNVM